MIGGVVATELLAQVFQVAAYGAIPGAFIANAAGGALAGGDPAALEAAFGDPVVGAHAPGGGVPVLPAVQQAPPHRDRDPQHRAAQGPAAGRAAGDGPRGRGRDVRHPDRRRPVVEGPARRLHVHRVRPLPGGLPGVEHRQAAQPQDVHHGHPPRGGRRRGRVPADPQLAVRARDRPGPRRPPRRGRAREAARRHGDPVRRRLGLPDLRRVRRGLPGHHRARRQDRRHPPQPRARGEPVPARS